MERSKIVITSEELRALLNYDPEIGVFSWKLRGKGRCRNQGLIAGTPIKGYINITINQRRYYAHRLAWLYVHGVWPKELDHINGDPSDNRIANLRECSRSQNLANRDKMPFNQSGFKGVKWNQTGWAAQIQKDRRVTHLGTYKTKEEAHEAYCRAAREQYGEFAKL